MRLLRLLALGAGLALAALVGVSVIQQPSAATRGTWATEGYGLALDIGRFTTRVYEVSGVHCTLSMTIPSNRWILNRFAGYRLSARADRLTIGVEDIVNPIHATRAPLPEACATPPPEDPASTYAVFWTTFAEHYPFFALYGIDWQARRDPGPLPDDAALHDALIAALAGLEDGHVYLQTDRGLTAARPDPDWIDDAPDFARASEALLSDMARLPQFGITHGRLPGDIAYIRIDHLDPPRPRGQTYRALATDIMAGLATLYGDAGGLVLDLRWNTGGSDNVALGYAGAFTDTPRVIGTKATQIAPGRLTDPRPIELVPSPGPGFDMPVIVLTADPTVSAAEVMVMALSPLPRVTTMGTPTTGALSDMMYRQLPNGWRFTLSHQVYRMPDGTLPEGRGLAPDIARRFDLDSFRAGRDTLLEEAAAALARGLTPSE